MLLLPLDLSSDDRSVLKFKRESVPSKLRRPQRKTLSYERPKALLVHINYCTIITNTMTDTNNNSKTAAVQVEGGSLKDRLKLLEEQRQRDAIKNNSTPTKKDLKIEGGGLQDRLAQLEKTRQQEAAKLLAVREQHITDPALVTDDLIRERMQWMANLQEQQQQGGLEKDAIIIEGGGGLKDRLQLLENTRKRDAARLASKTTDLHQVSDDLIRERLQFMDEVAQKNAAGFHSSNSKAAIVVQGGNLQERLRLLEEQRRRQAARAAGQTTDMSHVTDELIRERLQWMEQNEREKAGTTTAERQDAATVIKGGSLNVRKMLLREQTKREQARLAVRRLVDVASNDTVQSRRQWLQQQQKENAANPSSTATSSALMSSDLIAERMDWLATSAAEAAKLPEKERLERTNHLVEQRKAWLAEQLQQAAQLPTQERIQVSQGLIRERMTWLQDNLHKLNNNDESALSHKERTQMTTDLIAERIYLLEAQIAAHTASAAAATATEDAQALEEAAEAKANLELQINFLEEQMGDGDMTEEQVAPLLQVLMTEKIQDLEVQEQLVAELAENKAADDADDLNEQQLVEVTQALLEDRQAWLEGDPEHYQRKREDQRRAQEVAEASAKEEEETRQLMADEIARSIAFWTSQKEEAVNMSPAERAQVTAFLIAEHLVSLEVQVDAMEEDDATDADAKASLEQQIVFLNDQMDNIDDVDHLMMIDVLVQEKITGLEAMMVA